MMNDELKIEVLDNTPKGGQHSGAIPRGVIITHVPSGLKASCKHLRSQMKNRDVALAMIEAGLTLASGSCKSTAEDLKGVKRVLTLVDGYLSTQQQDLALAWDGGVMTYGELRHHLAAAIKSEALSGL